MCDTQKYDGDTYTDSVDTTLVRYHNRLAASMRCACFVQKMMMLCQQVPRIRYVSPYGLVLVLLCCREIAFSNHQIVHGLSPPPFSHPVFLKRWCSRHKTALSVSA